jgi:hypothetical protein
MARPKLGGHQIYRGSLLWAGAAPVSEEDSVGPIYGDDEQDSVWLNACCAGNSV